MKSVLHFQVLQYHWPHFWKSRYSRQISSYCWPLGHFLLRFPLVSNRTSTFMRQVFFSQWKQKFESFYHLNPKFYKLCSIVIFWRFLWQIWLKLTMTKSRKSQIYKQCDFVHFSSHRWDKNKRCETWRVGCEAQ